MQNARLKLKDKSTMSKGGYLFDHVLYGAIFAYDIYKILPLFVPIAYYNNSITRLVLCMVFTSLLGVIVSFNHNRTGLGVVVDIVAGMGFYTAFTVGQYTRGFIKGLVLVTIVISIIGILLIVCKKVKKKNRIKQIMIARFLRSVQLVRRNVGVAAAVVILVIPIGLKVVQHDQLEKDYYEKVYAESNSSSETVNSRYKNFEVNEIYGDEYKLSENIDTIKLIRDNDTFQSLNYEEKCEVIKAIICCEGRYLGLCEINIEFKELKDEILGQYCHSTRTITINSKQIKDGSLSGGSNKEVLNTCLHETRHAYQSLMGDLYAQVSPEQRNLLAFTEHGVGSWCNNIDNYHSDTSDIEGCVEYYNQPIEKDAREYATCESMEYFILIDELLNE